MLSETSAHASPGVRVRASSESAETAAAEPPAPVVVTPRPVVTAAPAAPTAPRPAPPARLTAEEVDSQHIDNLVATGDLGEAHAAAMDFVQEHPTGPLATHVMNLMGIHPRPAGAVPETPAMER